MLTNTGPVAKLYLSIIDDVIESMRELFLDEGIEDRVLDDLKHLWESKMMQSKAMEDFRKNNINSSNFVLQLPASYTQNEQEITASVVIPSSQKVQTYPKKTTSETVATFSLPAGLAYPVQIPAGVTLQTASGQLYKVNVPVVVTQAPTGQQPQPRPAPKVPAPAPKSQAVRVNTATVHEVAPSTVTKTSTSNPTPVPVPLQTNPAPIQEVIPPQEQEAPGIISVEAADIPESPSPEPEIKGEDGDQPVNLSMNAPPSDLLDFQMSANTTDIDDLLKEVIEKEREKVRNLDPTKDDVLGLDLDYSALSDIVQLDGAVDNSEDEEVAALEENDFLGIINAEAIKALQEGDASSDGNSLSSSDSEVEDELAHDEDEDPLNSGDDVIEQDIPDLFDTDNVIVCQYDKIHRSKNRWKFHLKDGVMTYGGIDYVFSKAVGEAEW
ncbi:TFIIA-alpha and beta-like factor [Boleophthalmus pectinirostris]|uniref:TFIIA-alpha and beta-like factor n=1 Tax=Boleophthalmus pectinirostris TaxID=150288 RepID=UPI00242C61FD|nr:TFIIA-alpha and beta-like factor [Boleophthalmus pectinirostris]